MALLGRRAPSPGRPQWSPYEHAAKAEQLLVEVQNDLAEGGGASSMVTLKVAIAQIHATLATRSV